MPKCPKPPRRKKKQGRGLSRTSEIKRTKALEGGKPLRPISKKREVWLEENNLPLSTFGRPIGKDRLQKQGMRWFRSRKPWTTVRRLTAATSRKLRSVLKRIGERGRRLTPDDLKWVAEVQGIWETCIITGARPGEGRWTVDADHCYPKQRHGHLRHNTANGVLLRHDIHMLAHRESKFRAALKAIADEALAAQRGDRLPVTRGEALGIVLRIFPKIRQYLEREAS
jgi:hypothetical protein